MTQNKKIVITGAAGLVGQNLIPRLTAKGYGSLVAIDKHASNLRILEQHHPLVRALRRDLAERNGSGAPQWQDELAGCDALVIGHAQIGGIVPAEFVRNNIEATERVLEAAVRHHVPYLVNISSSVVNSMAIDNYTETKKAQEALIVSCGIKQVVLRPTLMFGWFDRKHIGWLARFMQRMPIFPIPGSGRFLRQPLFAGDFCEVIASSIEHGMTGTYNITGLERIDYIDLIRAVKKATGSKAHIQKIPYNLFWAMLKINAIFDKNPAFTVGQLKALVTPDVFEVIDWPGVFDVRATPLEEALDTTFRHPVYSKVALDF
jgi:nucleoside-diphosphate-sugar epimerase